MDSTILLINASIPKSPRVAVVQGQKLVHLDLESQQPNRSKGNIYIGIISSIEPSLDAVFVNYGNDKHGFLPIKEIIPMYLAEGKDKAQSARLRVGQKILVQVEKERRGEKGAALTTFVALAGTYLVLMPHNPSAGGISKKADSNDRNIVRDKLENLNIPPEFSVIVRTAGVHRTIEELSWDLDSLITHWKHIEEAAAAHTAPCLIHQESDAILKAVRDLLHPSLERIVVDDLETYTTLKEYLKKVRPEFVDESNDKNNKLTHYKNSIPLFTHYQVEDQIEKLFLRKLDLPSGGAIVIDYAEAMTAIDVNSARATKCNDIEETALQTNLEAAEEISRQLRLRDISGIIVIDFIDMNDKVNRQKVEQAMAECTLLDRAKIRLTPICLLTGCLILSRQRVNTPLHETNQEACPTCSGQGLVRTIHSNAHMMLRKIEENAAADHTDFIALQLPVELGTYLLNECRDSIDRIQKDHETFVMVVPNPLIHYPKYLLKRHKIGKQALPESTKQNYDKPIPDSIPEWSRHHHQNEEPKVTQRIMKHPAIRKKNSVITRIVNFVKSLFGMKKAQPEHNRRRNNNNRNNRRSPIHRRRNTTNPPQAS